MEPMELQTEKQTDKQKRMTVLAYVLAVLVMVLGVTNVLLYERNRQLAEASAKNENLSELQAYVEKNFYQEVDAAAAEKGALKGYVAGLNDPYSVYLSAEEFGQWQEKESGTSVGIGITVQYTEAGTLLVIGVTANSPALAAGVQEGDEIVSIDGEATAELDFETAVSKVKGEAGTTVTLGIHRAEQELELEVERQELVTVTATGAMLPGKVAYIRIEAFRENTAAQYQAVRKELLKRGARSIVFDLRDNGGGLLNALEDVLDPLLPEGNIAVANFGNGDVRTIVSSDAEELFVPMAVLVNGNTASAAELFAASLRDFDKAFLVGENTYGKGVMQDTQQLAGGAVTLTVATYQTVRGECYQGTGLAPDYEIAPAENFRPDYEHPDPEHDYQLAKALEQLPAVKSGT